MRTLIITLFLANISFGQIANLTAEKLEKAMGDVNCVYMTRGPLEYPEVDDSQTEADECYAKALRVSFLVYEVYYSIAVEEMEYKDVECMDIKVLSSYFLSGFELGDSLSLGSLTWVQFIEWRTWDSFVISEQYDKILLSYKGNGNFEVELLEKK
jgi:hypothetical protein